MFFHVKTTIQPRYARKKGRSLFILFFFQFWIGCVAQW